MNKINAFFLQNVCLFGFTLVFDICLYILHIFFTFPTQIMFILALLEANDLHETNNRTLVKSV